MEFNLAFWSSLFEIFVINLILSGDNAVVIALATRDLEEKDRRKGIFWGTFGAVSLRIILTAGAALVLTIPYLQALGAILLLGIAVNLLNGEDQQSERGMQTPANLTKAIPIIITADLLMSLDNVLAVAGAAGGNLILLVIGLAVSIPIVIFGSSFLSNLMRKWPWIITVGSGLLGYTAGEMILKDQALAFLREIEPLEQVLPWLLALAIILAGKLFLQLNLLRQKPKFLNPQSTILNPKSTMLKKGANPPQQMKRRKEDLLQESFVQALAGKDRARFQRSGKV
ncbi:MAG: TerC family protein [Desulfitobacteriia bacterium]